MGMIKLTLWNTETFEKIKLKKEYKRKLPKLNWKILSIEVDG